MPDSPNGSNGIEGQEEEIELIFEEDEQEDSGSVPTVDDAEAAGRVEQLQSELDQLRELYLRKLAEFDNYRKRTERERVELHRTAGESVVRDLLPVIDNFERALVHGDEMDSKGFREGVEMISKQLFDVLERQGLAPIEPVGEEFKPEYHEAVQRVEDSEQEVGTVVSVLVKGYFFGGKLIRPAMVAVAVEPASEETEAEPQTVESDTVQD